MSVDDASVLAFEQHLERLYAEGRYEAVWRVVSDPEVATQARADATLLGVLLRALGAMVWHTPHAATVCATLRQAARAHGLESLIALTDAETVLAARCYRMRDGGRLKVRLNGRVLDVPDALIRLFGDRILVAPEWRAIAWRRAAEELADPMLLLTYCDCIVRYDPEFAAVMGRRLLAEAPPHRVSLGAMADGVRASLAEALRGIPPRPRLRRARDLALDLLRAFSRHQRRVVTAEGLRTLPHAYTTHVRLYLAQALAQVGAALPAALTWLELHPHEAGSLRRDAALLSSDLALQLCTVITAVFHALPRDSGSALQAPYRG